MDVRAPKLSSLSRIRRRAGMGIWAAGVLLGGLLVLPALHLIGHEDDHVHGPLRLHTHGHHGAPHSHGTHEDERRPRPQDNRLARGAHGAKEAEVPIAHAHGEGALAHFGAFLLASEPPPLPVPVEPLAFETPALRKSAGVRHAWLLSPLRSQAP